MRAFTSPSCSFFLSLWFRTTDGWLTKEQESKQRKKSREKQGSSDWFTAIKHPDRHVALSFLRSLTTCISLPLSCSLNHILFLSSSPPSIEKGLEDAECIKPLFDMHSFTLIRWQFNMSVSCLDKRPSHCQVTTAVLLDKSE